MPASTPSGAGSTCLATTRRGSCRAETAGSWRATPPFARTGRPGYATPSIWRPIRHVFRRSNTEWWLDGESVTGLRDLIHLDFGFTPATNLQQVLHADLAVGEEAEISAVWFDVGEPTLMRLPQRYKRVSADRYRYSSPTSGYEATLEMAASGFVRLYPDLWEMEPDA